MSCDHELANEWACCSGKSACYITTPSTRAVIGQFRGPYFPVRPAKIGSWFCCQTVYLFIFVIYRQVFLYFIVSKSLNLSFTLNCVLKRANDLKMISNGLVLLSRCARNLKPFRVNRKRS